MKKKKKEMKKKLQCETCGRTIFKNDIDGTWHDGEKLYCNAECLALYYGEECWVDSYQEMIDEFGVEVTK